MAVRLRVMIDANTLISGIVFRGNEHKLLLLEESGVIKLITPEDAVNEVKDTLMVKFPEYAKLVDKFIELSGMEIMKKELYQKDIDKHDIVRDKTDRYLLAAAHNKKCDIIVSGDKDLLVLGEYKGIKICKTREILSLIKSL